MANKNKKYKRSIEDAGRISDEEYYNIMEGVAERNYRDWGFPNSDAALLYTLNNNTYNYRGYYNKYPKGDGNAKDHWLDDFKTVYHPSFSNESIYSGKKSQYNPKGLKGGYWIGETFMPANWQRNKKENGGISYEEYNNTTKSERATAAKAANARERAIAKHYFNAGPNIVNLAKAAYHLWNGVPHLGGQDESGNIFNTGIAPTPGFRKGAFVEAAKKIGILKGARTVSDAGKAAYKGRVMADREAIKLSGKKYISPYNNPSKGKLYNNGAITANDVFEETSKARLVSNTKTNKVNPAANSTKKSRSIPYLTYADDYIKKNKLSTFMGSNGKMYIKTSDGKVKSLESLEKELRPY